MTTPIADTTPAALEAILAAASRANATTAVSTAEQRSTLLEGLASALEADRDDLVAIADAETHLGVVRLNGELARTTGQLRLFAAVLSEGSWSDATIDVADSTVSPPRPDLRRMLVPIGPVLVYAASNFPFAFSVLGGDTASALAAGCPVVVKAHGGHPLLSQRCGQLARAVVADTGFPDGTIDVIFGETSGVEALSDRRVRACGFTGSTTGGRFLYDIARGRPDPIPFYGELGGVNPVAVTPAAVDARGPQLATGFVDSFTLGTGQFCTKPGLLFLPRGHGLDALLGAAVAQLAPSVMLNPSIREQHLQGVTALSARDDVTALHQADTGAAADDEVEGVAPSLFVTSSAAWRADAQALGNECFGPVSLIIEYDDAADLLACLGGIDGALAAAVHAEDSDDYPVAEIVATLRDRAGRLVWNGWPTGVTVGWAMQHGGPWPVATDSAHTSVGAAAIRRWLRPVAYQAMPDRLLPAELKSDNPLGIPRRLSGALEVPGVE